MTSEKPPPTEKLKNIRILLLDVDGVLTDGKIIYNDQGIEIKEFNVKDGLGIRMLMLAGITVGIVTGRSCPALLHRLNNLGIDLVLDGVKNKADVLEKILNGRSATANQIAFMGDDLPDLSLMKRVGLSIAVADAHPLVRAEARMITASPGGSGAVREVCDAILTAQGLWENILERL